MIHIFVPTFSQKKKESLEHRILRTDRLPRYMHIKYDKNITFFFAQFSTVEYVPYYYFYTNYRSLIVHD